MKWIVAIAVIALFACAHAAEEEVLEEGDARLGYITVGSNGDTSITFNATSIQNAIIVGLIIIVIGAIILPIIGVKVFEDDAGSTGYGYGYEQTGYDTGAGYSQPTSGYGHSFAKRSLAMMAPVLDMLSAAYKKYDD